MSTVYNEKGYYMRLANWQEWDIAATREAKPLMEQLVSIMELKPCMNNGAPKLLFTNHGTTRNGCIDFSSTNGHNRNEEHHKNGWSMHRTRDFQIWSHCNAPDVVCELVEKNLVHDTYVLPHSITPVYRRAQESGGLTFHAALVEWKGKGILLAGSGGQGKSTNCRRLPPPWHVLCDDETLIVRDARKRYVVHPFPTWSRIILENSDEKWDVQRYIPLSAIFFLDKAETDKITRLGRGQTAVYCTESAKQTWTTFERVMDCNELKEIKRKLFDNACELAELIPGFALQVSLEGQFWLKIEELLSSELAI